MVASRQQTTANRIASIVFHPDESIVFYATDDGDLYVWNWSEDELVQHVPATRSHQVKCERNQTRCSQRRSVGACTMF